MLFLKIVYDTFRCCVLSIHKKNPSNRTDRLAERSNLNKIDKTAFKDIPLHLFSGKYFKCYFLADFC